MGAKQDKISDLDPIKLMDYASSQLTEFDLKIYKLNQKIASFQDQLYNYQYSIDQKIENKYNQLYEKLEKIENLISASTFNKPPDVEAAIDSNSSNKKNLNNLKENLLKKNDIINNEFILKNINYQEENNLIIKNSDSYSNNLIIKNSDSFSKANVIINNTNDQKINSIIEPILPVIIENPYYINEKLLQKINIYLFGIKIENEKYFQAINENFKYIKTIDINFSLLINSIKRSEIRIENPSLVIFLSPDYRGRLPDNWTSITEYVYNYTSIIN